MTSISSWAMVIICLAGFYLAVFRVLIKNLQPLILEYPAPHGIIFLTFLAWSLSSGLVGIIPMWGYFLNVSPSFVIPINGFFGLFLFFWSRKLTLRSNFNLGSIVISTKPSIAEFTLVLYIVLIGILYLYRTTIPWSDMDEASCYGYLSKLISGGRTFKDICEINTFSGFIRSPLILSWDSVLYGLVNDTYLVRLGRLANIIFCSLGIFSFLRIAGVARFWALTCTAGFMSIPEFSYLGLSLKVDAPVMMFELAAFLCLTISCMFLWSGDLQEKIRAKGSVVFAFLALVLSVFSVANRFSGIIPVFLSLGFLWYCLFLSTKRIGKSLLIVVGSCLAAGIIAAPGYWINVILYNNPFYPAKGIWPFDQGVYTVTIEEFKKSWNINGLPAGILQLYLIFVLGTGLEMLTKIFPFLNILPATTVKLTSMGWPYPLIFCIFFWPFFIRKHKVLNLIAGIFIFQLICWSQGLHYSRIFVASIVLTFIAGAIIADLDIKPGEGLKFFIRQILRFWIFFSLGISLIFHFWWFQKNYEGLWLFGEIKRHQARSRLLTSKICHDRNIPTPNEIKQLNQFFLNSSKTPVVNVYTSSRELMHVFFSPVIYVKPFETIAPYKGDGTFLLINPAYLSEVPVNIKKRLLQFYPVHVLTLPQSGWELYRDR